MLKDKLQVLWFVLKLEVLMFGFPLNVQRWEGQAVMCCRRRVRCDAESCDGGYYLQDFLVWTSAQPLRGLSIVVVMFL